jgi:hypothetical protein
MRLLMIWLTADPVNAVEVRDDIHEAFLSLACAIICWRRLTNLGDDRDTCKTGHGLILG